MSRIEYAVQQIESARSYTQGLVDGTDDADWFEQPFEGANHIAWQVGHIIVAQYGLTVEAVHGRQPEDGLAYPSEYRKLFGRSALPEGDAGKYPSPRELREQFHAAHQHVVGEVKKLDDRVLDEPPEWSHPLCPTKRDALHFCGMHELVHAGQIGMLRRMLGKKWLR